LARAKGTLPLGLHQRPQWFCRFWPPSSSLPESGGEKETSPMRTDGDVEKGNFSPSEKEVPIAIRREKEKNFGGTNKKVTAVAPPLVVQGR